MRRGFNPGSWRYLPNLGSSHSPSWERTAGFPSPPQEKSAGPQSSVAAGVNQPEPVSADMGGFPSRLLVEGTGAFPGGQLGRSHWCACWNPPRAWQQREGHWFPPHSSCTDLRFCQALLMASLGARSSLPIRQSSQILLSVPPREGGIPVRSREGQRKKRSQKNLSLQQRARLSCNSC